MSVKSLYGLLLKRDVTDEDLGEAKLDKEMTSKFAMKHRGSVRLSTGRYYTKEEWRDRRESLLKVKLP